jgi:lipopolysaccharide/colanic/teichoic acid biosynthesis glycosyltransferase
MESMTVEKLNHTEPRPVKTPPKVSWWYLFVKRCFDFVTSALASIILLIPMVIIGLMVVAKSLGSPFYVQERVGQGGKRIRVYKFRSMKKNADHLEQMLTPEQLEEYRAEYKLVDDPRLLGYKKPGDGSRCFGAVIRKTSLDELPQIFFNILIRGNMSVVGPRPILPEELEENYTPEEQVLLLSVKPGLTGYWQAYARNDATYASGERQKMELHYIRNRSFRLDIKIILQTVISVLRKTGAR